MLVNEVSFFSFLRAWAQLIRLPNVMIIILTQFLLRYCIILPNLYVGVPEFITPFSDFLILVLVTVFIATGGYVINDYFDVKADSINRPGKLVINKLIDGRVAIKIHMILNIFAIMGGVYLSWRVQSISFGLFFPFISGLLWVYSAKYKRTFFWGNFIVAALSAFVILIIWLFEFYWLRLNVNHFIEVLPDIHWVASVIAAYAIFAFLLSMVREIIKDMEDAEGDQAMGCRTLPIVLGMKNTRSIVAAMLLATITLLFCAQIALYQLNMVLVFWYLLFAVQSGAFYLLIKLFRSHGKRDYHNLSRLCKLIMAAGILSMGVLLISN